MGNCAQTDSQSVCETQQYHGAKGPLQFTLGVDKVLNHWIRRCGWTLDEIPTDVFRFVLKYTSFFDDFQFQEHHLWQIQRGDDWRSARKRIGGGVHHSVLFGSVLTGDIEYSCTVTMPLSRYMDSKREQLSIGLVESDFFHYQGGEQMHRGQKRRCVFTFERGYDCTGNAVEYEDTFQFRSTENGIKLVITVNMKARLFSITDVNGCRVTINDIPDERVICFQVWPVVAVEVTNQAVKWV